VDKSAKILPNPAGTTSSRSGTIAAVRGSVVDVFFAQDLPPIKTVLRTGNQREIVLEVLAQLDQHRVRGIALTPTQGLARGFFPGQDRTIVRIILKRLSALSACG
jgi:F0F1-type ATP synthase beta subunit